MSRSRVVAVLVMSSLIGFEAPAMAAPPEQPASLPDYHAPLVPEPRPLSVPADGMGAFGVAGVCFGFALLGFGGTANLIVRGDSSTFWGMALGSAIPATIMGATALGIGVRNRRRYRAWAAETGIEAPKQGNGLVGSGAMLLIGGSAAVTIGGISANFNGGFEFSEPRPTPLDPLAISIGVTSIVVGTGLLIGGASRSGRFERWRAGQVITMPSFAPMRGGLAFGLSGRF